MYYWLVFTAVKITRGAITALGPCEWYNNLGLVVKIIARSGMIYCLEVCETSEGTILRRLRLRLRLFHFSHRVGNRP